MPDNPYKISTSVGGDQFTADGDQDAVREDFRAFLEAVKAVASAKANAATPAAPAPPPAGGSGGGPAAGGGVAGGTVVADPVDATLLQRVFLVRENVVTLQALPHGDDAVQRAIVALLYGFSKLMSTDAVTALALAKALRVSGLAQDRIDRDIGPIIGSLITKSGAGRGTKYGLTNPGKRRAEEIIRELLG